jgi:hypothetical protein
MPIWLIFISFLYDKIQGLRRWSSINLLSPKNGGPRGLIPYKHHQKGSHTRLFHQQKPELKVTVPVHNKDLPEKTLRRILKQAHVTDDKFLKLLRE